MKHFLWTLMLIYGSCCCVFAQNKSKIDSLIKALAGNQTDTLGVRTMLLLSAEYFISNPNRAFQYSQEANRLSDKLNYNFGRIQSLAWLAYFHEQNGQIDTALSLYQKSYELAIKTGNKNDAATCLNNIAAIYKDLGKIDEALEFHQRSLSIKLELGKQEGIASSYNNIGLIYQNQGKIPDALNYYNKALKIFEELKDKQGIATVYENTGFIYKDQKQYDLAFDYLQKSLKIHIEDNDKYGIGYSWNALGNLCEEQNKLLIALNYYEQALKVRTEINDNQGIFYTWKNIGNIHNKLGNKEEAKRAYEKSLSGIEALGDKWGIAIVTNLYGAFLLNESQLNQSEAYLSKSLGIAKELGFPTDIRNAAENLQALYRKKGRWKEALAMNDLFIEMKDSVQNEKNHKLSIQTQFQYEYEKKEAILKIEQAKKDALAQKEIQKQRLILVGISGGLILVVLFSIALIRQRNKIAKGKKRSDELLLNILPEEVAEELKETGSAKAKSFDNVTVLFTDFEKFTEISQKLTAEELVEEINYCYSEFDKIITKYGIEKIKTIGDSYMCVGGLPTTNTSHPWDVVKAAMEFQEFITKNINHRKNQGKPYFELRIGIHTGPVVAGIVGIKKFAYDIWGDTVNTASRMETSGEAGKVNISGATYDYIKDIYTCTYRGKISVKHKGEIDMYFIEGARN
ncbi:MAG: tetratricopeptide repeat protein [Saprospiraceae bacterium]|nr:tetratricopeptide repeat protein [Saprospiraceae bacterium]MBK7736269.1 tetratricopeptide repeat protein [Saprospiraceae bacterium]MBK7912365.1 tetratricopeptide repeat protein [Saprospiraceae bacterium]